MGHYIKPVDHPGDDLKSKDPRLIYRWRWIRVASGFGENELKIWTHFQGSCCKVGNWQLAAIQWSKGKEGDWGVWYESSVSWGFESIVKLEERHETRLDAQIGAEALLEEFIRTEYNRIIPK